MSHAPSATPPRPLIRAASKTPPAAMSAEVVVTKMSLTGTSALSGETPGEQLHGIGRAVSQSFNGTPRFFALIVRPSAKDTNARKAL